MKDKNSFSFFEGVVITFIFISFLICVSIVAFKVGGGVFDWKNSTPLFVTAFIISCGIAFIATKKSD